MSFKCSLSEKEDRVGMWHEQGWQPEGQEGFTNSPDMSQRTAGLKHRWWVGERVSMDGLLSAQMKNWPINEITVLEW